MPVVLVLVVAVVVGGLWFYQRTPGRTMGIPAQAQRVVVEVKRGGGTVTFGGATVPLANGLEVGIGAVITTNPDSTVLVRIDRDSWLTIDGGSTVTLTALGQAKTFSLGLGRLSVRIGRILGKEERFEVKTPNSVAAVRGTRFGVAFIRGRTKVVVLEHRVNVTPLDPRTGEALPNVKPVTVNEQQQLEVESTSTLAGKSLQPKAATAEDLTSWRVMLEQQPTIELHNAPPAGSSGTPAESAGTNPASAPAPVVTPPTTSAEPTPEALKPESLPSTRSHPIIQESTPGINFVQPIPAVFLPGQRFTFQLQEVIAGGKHTVLVPSSLDWSVDGDPGIGDIDEQGVFMAGPYGGNGEVHAIKTQNERVIFERILPIQIKGNPAPPGFQQG